MAFGYIGGDVAYQLQCKAQIRGGREPKLPPTPRMDEDVAEGTQPNPMNHLFIGGPPRSGTTLLELMLSAHPAVTVAPEAIFIERLIALRLPPRKPLTVTGANLVRRAMFEDRKLSAWPRFDRDEFLASGVVRPGVRPADILDAMFLCYARLHDGGTQWIGNKKGVYAEVAGLYLKQVFPDAKFVFIVRDPRDAVPSIVSKLNYSPARAARQIVRRGIYISSMCDKFPEDFHFLRYEDLVIDPLPTCERLCKFLDLEPSPRMLDFHKVNREGARLLGDKKTIHQHTRGPLNPTLVERWRRDLPARKADLAEIEAPTTSFMARFGYYAEFTHQGGAIQRIMQSVRIRLATFRAVISNRKLLFLRRVTRRK